MKKPARSIILCGIKHCGKSTQGKRLAAALGLDFYDTDDLIFEQTGMDARAIYKSQGKDALMAAELKACEYLRDILQAKSSQGQNAAAAKSAVIATGGGICQNEPAIAILKKLGTIVYLEVPEITAAGRIVREARFLPDGTIQNLPAYIANKNPADQKEVRAIFHDFYMERTKKYRSLADASVQAQGSRSENTKKILSALGLD
ncbi:MAG: shikimate kinase [Treponema sp.]|nr:shikimate kinase [Treponema sp.]MEE3434422.1 shikimate kinase [Treponema sp.]